MKVENKIYKTDLKVGNEVIVEEPTNVGEVYSIKILQNWRDILKIHERGTSGGKTSDVWNDGEIYWITLSDLVNELNKHILSVNGWNIYVY